MSKSKSKKKGGTVGKIKPTESVLSNVSTQTRASVSSEPMLFGRQNYILILAGLGLIFLGYILMSGGNMPDSNTWDADLIYSTRRTLIAPICILAGLGLEIYAVFKK